MAISKEFKQELSIPEKILKKNNKSKGRKVVTCYQVIHKDDALRAMEEYADLGINQLEKIVMWKIRKVIKELVSKSYLANDVWDVTAGVRKYQNISMPTIELKTVIKILQKYFPAKS